jgi:hypothetical protein
VPELHFTDAELDRFADLIADRVQAPLDGRSSSWLNAAEPAAYLACSVSRIRKLTMTGGASPRFCTVARQTVRPSPELLPQTGGRSRWGVGPGRAGAEPVPGRSLQDHYKKPHGMSGICGHPCQPGSHHPSRKRV